MLMTFLFVVCFLGAEIFVSRYIILAAPFARFFLRIVLLALYTLLIKYLFEYFENGDGTPEKISGIPEPSGHSVVEGKTPVKTIHHEENGLKNDERRTGSIDAETKAD